MFVVTEQEIKDRAKLLKQFLLTEHELNIPHGQCLKIISQVFGFKNWNTAKALLGREQQEMSHDPQQDYIFNR